MYPSVLQLLTGATKEQRENLGITTPDYYFYMNQSGTYTVEDINDKKEFSDTMVCLRSLENIFTNELLLFLQIQCSDHSNISNVCHFFLLCF